MITTTFHFMRLDVNCALSEWDSTQPLRAALYLCSPSLISLHQSDPCELFFDGSCGVIAL